MWALRLAKSAGTAGHDGDEEIGFQNAYGLLPGNMWDMGNVVVYLIYRVDALCSFLWRT